MRDNTQTVQDYLDHVAERLEQLGMKAKIICLEVPSKLAHALMPWDQPYISIHFEDPNTACRMFPGKNAGECMDACHTWLEGLERKAA